LFILTPALSKGEGVKIGLFYKSKWYKKLIMNWSAKIITHKKEKRIAVYFEKDIDLIARIKRLDG
jgi:hypothetical protein